MTTENNISKSDTAYTRDTLSTSKKYRAQCDVIMCALEPDKQYTENEANRKIAAFLETAIEEKINGKEVI